MTSNQRTILTCLEANLANAKTPAMREMVLEQIKQFKESCKPKPQPTRPAWVDKF